MELVLADWIGLVLRWAHVMTGIAWIGTSFYFIWLDASLRKRQDMAEGLAGESWQVHGGGFYQVEKYLVAPAGLPEELHWFKYEAYFTWLTGIGLLIVLYYWSASSFLVDATVMELSPRSAILISAGSLAAGWGLYDLACRSPLGGRTAPLALFVFLLIVLAAFGYGQVFGGRAAFLHVGALIGTIMVGNVFFVIIPNQKKTVAALKAGETPEARFGLQAKQRSLHNNYLTLPVIVTMVSSHYPLLYAQGRGWIMAAGIVLVGGLVRHWFNSHNSGQKDWSFPFLLPGALAGLALLIAVSLVRPANQFAGEALAYADVAPILRARCVSCHAVRPTDGDFDAPPADLVFEQPAQVKAAAQRIYAQTVLSDAMPLGNKTEITPEERALLGAWIDQGAPLH